jgi:ribosomal protein S18 acetylase RimI-like enzyme
VTVRPAAADDVAALAAGNVRLAAESEGRALETALVERGVRRILADPARGAYWVAEAGGAVRGQCLVTTEWSDWSDGRYWWFQSVWVEPDWRGRGVFRALWDRVLEAAREAGDVASIRLYVEEENAPARAVYERLGMDLTSYRMYELPLPRDGAP